MTTLVERLSLPRALLLRELRAAAPWFVFYVGGVVFRVFEAALDDQASAGAAFGVGADGLWLHWAIALIFGAAVGSRDVRSGAAGFLDTLPVDRLAWFVARVVSGVLILAVANFAVVVVGLAALAHGPGSASTVPLGEMLTITAALFAYDVCAFVIGLLLAPMPLGAGLVIFVGLFASLYAMAVHQKWISLTPISAGDSWLVGGSVVVQRLGLLVNSVVSAFALIVAGLIASTPSGQKKKRSSRPRLVKWLMRGAAAVTLVGGAVGVLAAWPIDEPDEHWSRHCRFSLLGPAIVNYDAIKDDVDGDLDAVERYFGRGFGRGLHINATASLPDNHGLASGVAIAVDRNTGMDRFVIVHEATHVMANLISGGAASAVRVFSEGLANHVARQIAPVNAPHDVPGPLLARLVRDDRINDSNLVDADTLERLEGRLVVYAVGEELVGALVDVYGEEAPRRVLLGLRAAWDDGARGSALWPAALHRTGMMMSPIASRFFARVAAFEPEGPIVRVVPFVAAAVDDEMLRIRGVNQDGKALMVYCWTRNPQSYGNGAATEGCSIAPRALTGGVVEVRVQSAGGYSDWLRLPLPGL